MQKLLNFSDLTKDQKQELERVGILRMKSGESFLTNYFLVYGTLRLGMGNWAWCFNKRTKHIATLELPGFLKSRGISCEFTGDTSHVTVFDLFQVTDEFDRINAETDALEGVKYDAYRACAVRINLEDGPIIAKFYEAPWSSAEQKAAKNPKGDYVGNVYKTYSSDLKERLKQEAPKAYEYYFKEEVEQEKITE
jgi:gamma-glutamylcyclotransferase (GGCT)/AIG2-like uncharacterized protein YtfP